VAFRGVGTRGGGRARPGRGKYIAGGTRATSIRPSVVPMFRRLTPFQLTVDVGIAALCFLLRGTMTLDDPVTWLMVGLMAAALAIRRLSPGLALGVAWLGAIVQMLASLPPDAANIAILAVLFATARYGGRLIRWVGLASAVVGALVSSAYTVLFGGIFGPVDVALFFRGFAVSFFAALATLGLSWTLGLLWRTWDNARQSRRDQLAAEQSMIVEQERNRIARDMHDVVAHSLAVVIAQADGARYAGDKQATDAALATISSAAREALADVRLLLGQLRHSQDAGPQPLLADLDRLVEQLRSSGLVVAVGQRGVTAPLPAARELAIYRIVQEALTNALRHGDTEEEVLVTIEWGPDAASLTISNALRLPAKEPRPGHGMTGMRERALLVGGELDAGAEGDHWVVTARIPL
jgi:signal transduction histidine kinase